MNGNRLPEMIFEPRILVVDDEKRIRDGCYKMLVSEGFQVETAETAELGLAVIEKEHFDIILLDLMMPGLSGLDALARFRGLHPDTLVIVITGYATLEHSIDAMKKGAFDFIPKPFSPEDLRTVILKALNYIRNLQDIATENSRMRALINHLTDGVLAVDSRRQIALANSASLQMIGCEGKPVIGHRFTEIVRSDKLIRMIEQALSMPGHEFRELSEELHAEDGENGNGKVFGARCVPFRDRLNRTLGAIAVLHDITSSRKIDQLKSNFVSMVSHEIRSPMNTVLAQINVILDGLAGRVSGKQREILGRCSQKVKSLADLATELLDLSRIESGLVTQEKEKLNVVELLNQQLDFHREQAESKKIILEGSPMPDRLPVLANRYNLQEVIANLISNAIKYTPDNGRVSVSAKAENGCLCVRVSDNGIGISEEDLKRIFDRFYRVRNEKTRFVIGTGLGLSIVKSVVEAHNGRIRVESELDKGTTFSVYLPLLQS